MSDTQVLKRLIETHRRGFSLSQPFYIAPTIFEAEVDVFLSSQWMIAGHTSEIPQQGDYFVIEALNASLIVTRGKGGEIHALHNVCRHRGAKVCEESRGKASVLRCRYHGWSYRLDGELAAWRHMPDGLKKSDYSLRRCGIFVFEGLILLTLDPAKAPDAATMLNHVRDHWARYDLANCKVAATETYRIAANWKLAIENNLECYHCLPSHPEYSAANAFVRADEKISDQHVKQFSAYQAAWRARLRAAGIPSGRTELVTTAGQICRAGTWPLASGQLTGSRDGKPLAPLLGGITDYDESVTTGAFGFLSYVFSMCDYALIITYVPQSAVLTHAVMKWLVRADACEGVDYQPGALRWLWDETTKQDKSIIELNAAGVSSRSYEPGPYSELEWLTGDFIERYLALMGASA